MKPNRDRALGKGLNALLKEAETGFLSERMEGLNGNIASIPISDIEPNPYQPRKSYDQDALKELSDSIKSHGVIQPVTLRKMGYGRYQLISGERRYRAAEMAGVQEIPAYIRIADDRTMLEMALIENIHREDLDAIEIGESYRKLMEECRYTQEELSVRVGKKRSTIANYLRLLKLPDEIQTGIRRKLISMGHARAITGVEDKDKQKSIYYNIIRHDLSVRQAEELARNPEKIIFKGAQNNAVLTLSDDERRIMAELETKLGASVKLSKYKNGKGSIIISYSDSAELHRITAGLFGQ